MKDILSIQGVWVDGGAGPTPAAPTTAGFVGILALQGVWINGGASVVAPAPPATPVIAVSVTNPGLRTATLTGVGL